MEVQCSRSFSAVSYHLFPRGGLTVNVGDGDPQLDFSGANVGERDPSGQTRRHGVGRKEQ